MGFEGFPFIVGWELTLQCNLRCRHCASTAGLPRCKELTLAEALAVSDQFAELAVKEVNFTGGEALLRHDWWRIALHVAKKNITTRIVTNGLLLTPRRLAQMQDVGISSIGVSVDGLEVTHDEIRGHSGLWRHVLDGIKRATDAELAVGAITAVNARNLSELPALLPILESVGVKHWQLQPILPLGRGKDASDLHLTEQDYLKLGMFFRDQQQRTDADSIKVLPADSLGYYTSLDLADPPWRGCPAGQYAVAITSDGKVKGCLTLPDNMIEGDLRKDDLWNIWFREGAFSNTRQFSIEQMGPNCQGCDMAEQCGGGCSSMSYVCSGCFHNDPYCFYGISNKKPQVFERMALVEGSRAGAVAH